MANTIDNFADVLDSRDIIERIEELRGMVEAEAEELPEFRKEEAISLALTEAEAEELHILEALQEEAEGYSPDWTYGAQLIRESYFEEAMDEMVADCYTLPKDLPFWMTITYDYDALKQDYTGVDFNGVTYYVR